MSKYTAEITSEDEDGNAEHWTVNFKRVTVGAMDGIAALHGADEQEQATRSLSLIPLLVRSAECNGEDVAVVDMPFDMAMEVFVQHPYFRRSGERG